MGGLSSSPLCLTEKIKVAPCFLGRVVKVAPGLLRLTPDWSYKPRGCCRRDMGQLRAEGDYPATMSPQPAGSPSLPGLMCPPCRVCSRGTLAPSQTLLRTKGCWLHPQPFAAPHESL